ncbi:serine hydrolase domain-containing protein [Thalassobellus sediminis]|uniref:serine hydrolase domain-containing protein n=1 Tax=Thalassobellus sediminis TaxID=3367753 RepID=UPI003789CEFD
MFSFFNQLFAQNTFGEFNKAERIVEKIIRRHKVPGLAITVSKNQEVVWSQGFGYSDLKNKTPVNPKTTIFRIGSISKPIASIALLNAVEEGLIMLDSSVYNYVPYFPKKEYDITIRQLGGHLSGIRNYKGNEFKNNKPLTIREGVKLFENDSLLFKPGTNYAYTSYNWNLISLAIQEQAKIPFEEFVETRVLTPFQMKKTFSDKNEALEGKAVFYKKVGRKRFKPVREVNNYFKLASGGYLSTSEDINILGNALLKGSLVNKNQLKPFIIAQKTKNSVSKSTYYGLGFQVSYDSSGRFYFGHIGNGLGGYGIFYVYPDQEVVISILINCSNPNIDKKFDKLIDTIFESIELN